jgi:hypothetical protein
MTTIHITLSTGLNEFIDRYRVTHGCQSSTEVIELALMLLQEQDLAANSEHAPIWDVHNRIDSNNSPASREEREPLTSLLPRDRSDNPQDSLTQKRSIVKRSGITIVLIVFFGVSLLAEFLLIGEGAFYPQANVTLIKDTLPLLINSLTSLVTLALVFDFKNE